MQKTCFSIHNKSGSQWRHRTIMKFERLICTTKVNLNQQKKMKFMHQRLFSVWFFFLSFFLSLSRKLVQIQIRILGNFENKLQTIFLPFAKLHSFIVNAEIKTVPVNFFIFFSIYFQLFHSASRYFHFDI